MRSGIAAWIARIIQNYIAFVIEVVGTLGLGPHELDVRQPGVIRSPSNSCSDSRYNKSAPEGRISAGVIFRWRVVSAKPN
jgi:hypothetical protein